MADYRSDSNGEHSQPLEKRETLEKLSTEDDANDHYDNEAHRNISFSSQKEAQEYERKKANALLANPLRGLSHRQLRKMGRDYALGKQLTNSWPTAQTC